MTTTGDRRSTSDRALACAQCGTETVSTAWTSDAFTWGEGDSAVTLPVRVPVRSCSSCGFSYLDHKAEDIRHAAVCDHLGVLAPSAIRAIRRKYGMSQAEFTRITGFGEATISRWENGIVIQNVANDRYLRLLREDYGVMTLLRELVNGRGEDPAKPELRIRPADRRFRKLEDISKHRRNQQRFALRLAS